MNKEIYIYIYIYSERERYIEIYRYYIYICIYIYIYIHIYIYIYVVWATPPKLIREGSVVEWNPFIHPSQRGIWHPGRQSLSQALRAYLRSAGFVRAIVGRLLPRRRLPLRLTRRHPQWFQTTA